MHADEERARSIRRWARGVSIAWIILALAGAALLVVRFQGRFP